MAMIKVAQLLATAVSMLLSLSNCFVTANTSLFVTGVDVSASLTAGTWTSMPLSLPQGTGFVAYSGAIFRGQVVIGGQFSSNGAANIAAWNGTTWTALGNGTNDVVMCVAVFNDTLYAGGRFLSAGGAVVNYIAQWNGSAWAALAGGVAGYQPTVNALAYYQGNVIVAGYFYTVGGITFNFIGQWNGSHWSPLAGGLSTEVESLAVFNGYLIVGGQFLYANGGNLPANRIAQWDGTQWFTLGSGVVGGFGLGVLSLAVYGSNLVVGGDFTSAGGVNASYISQWDGLNWAPLGAGMEESLNVPLVYALAVFNGKLVAGGQFGSASGVSATAYLAAWDGASWSSLGSYVGNNVFGLLAACSPGWDGVDCTECFVGFYGADCLPCSVCDVHGSCVDGLNGNCTCDAGWANATCSQCAPGYFGTTSCSPCSTCLHGTCTSTSCSSCTAGWTGTLCDTCRPNYFGTNCVPCTKCLHGTCIDGINGSCTCTTGWAGTECTVCAPQVFGAACNESCADCNGLCYPGLGGNCTCQTGWTGVLCTDCAAGFFGAACTPCSWCQLGTCSPGTSGTCSCFAGAAGQYCDSCESGFYGATCTDCNLCAGTCYDGISGNCTCSDARWSGSQCDQCAGGYFGSNCTACSECVNGTCESGLAGSCVCNTGWEGTLCDKCDPTHFGPECAGMCTNCVGGACTAGLEGNCTASCKPQWAPPNCAQCAQGYFGPNCTACAQCVHGSCVSGVLGYCGPCATGWTGVLCNVALPTATPTVQLTTIPTTTTPGPTLPPTNTPTTTTAPTSGATETPSPVTGNNANNAAEANASQSTTLAIILGTCGGVALIAILVTVGLLLKRRRQRKPGQADQTLGSKYAEALGSSEPLTPDTDQRNAHAPFDPDAPHLTPPSYSASTSSEPSGPAVGGQRSLSSSAAESQVGHRSHSPSLPSSEGKPFTLDNLTIPLADVHIDMNAPLGSGSFGSVYKGNWLGSPVAIKQIRGSRTGTEPISPETMHEIGVMCRLKYHPNIIQLSGVIVDNPPDIYLIVEFCELGSVEGAFKSPTLRKQIEPLKARRSLLADVAMGMTYLHSKGIIHGDLAARNILLRDHSNRITACVSDFGLANELKRGAVSLENDQQQIVPVRWSAPEVLDAAYRNASGALYGTASDVWSFGVVMYEVHSLGLLPYHNLQTKEEVVRFVCERRDILPQAPTCPDADYAVMLRCLAFYPDRRPSLREVRGLLSQL